MKKYIFILLLIILTPCVWAQTMQHNSVMPGFFVPNGALKTDSQPKQLPPVETMVYGQKMSEAYAKAQAQQTQQSNAQTKENQAKSTKDTNRNVISQQQKTIPSKPITTADSDQKAKTENKFLPKIIEKAQPDVSTPKPENKPQQAGDIAEKAPVAVTEVQNKAPSQQAPKQEAPKPGSPQDIFARMFDEHQRDLQAIGRGEFVENARLNKILADYKNQEHLFDY